MVHKIIIIIIIIVAITIIVVVVDYDDKVRQCARTDSPSNN